jgi:hypothetical protein
MTPVFFFTKDIIIEEKCTVTRSVHISESINMVLNFVANIMKLLI